MKNCVAVTLLIAILWPVCAAAQLNNGGLYAGFGVDADTRANFMKYGIVTGAVISDDWFAPSGVGNNVIDTSNFATYLTQLQAGSNLAFSKRMSQLLYSKVSGKLWLDAAYGRDYSSAASLKDSTVFSIAAKNGDDPNLWQGGIASTPNKNDLVDVYAHMRRDGMTVYDSLWFFTGIVAYGNAANSYYDVELYKNNFSYNSTTRTFSSAGTSGGHTEWIFDATGKITQTGDMIVAVSFMPGSVPVIDVRIWVSQATYTAYHGGGLAPAYFNFSTFSTVGGIYGYASIVSKTGTTAFGGGIANYSGTPSQDTTYATPWGTSNSTSGWSPFYQVSQFIEVGLNLTRIGVDPALYSTLNPCQSMFSDIFFKSRSSSSFTANLQDFVAPLTFLRPPVMDFSAQGDTLRCNHPSGTITLTNNSTAGNYTWKTINGGTISGASADSSQLNITKPGTYIVSASPASGCPATRVDTIVVPIDTFPPVASALVGLSGNQLALYGGNPVASNYPTPFGGSQGLTYNWSGPLSFTSTLQNPLTDTVWGTYNLTVTEKRNGCTATASTDVLASMFDLLLANSLSLEGTARAPFIDLSWKDLDQSLDLSFVVERSDGLHDFQAIGTVLNPHAGGSNSPGSFAFTDTHPLPGNNLYRLKAVLMDGRIYYSQTVTVGSGISSLLTVALASDPGAGGATLFINARQACKAELVEYSAVGQVLEKKALSIGMGLNTITIPPAGAAAIKVLALVVDGRLAWCQKLLAR
jgi:hypothetical protein